jgi:hypothetical protein
MTTVPCSEHVALPAGEQGRRSAAFAHTSLQHCLENLQALAELNGGMA